MTTSIYEAGDDRMVPDDDQMPEDDQMVPEKLTADPAGAVVGDDPQSPASAVSECPGTTVSAAGAQPRPARDSPLAIDSTRAAGRWNEIQAMFVDDPRTSVELAAGLVDDSVEAHVRSVKERQHSLLSAWGAMTREPRTCVSRCSSTVRSGAVSKTSLVKLEDPLLTSEVAECPPAGTAERCQDPAGHPGRQQGTSGIRHLRGRAAGSFPGHADVPVLERRWRNAGASRRSTARILPQSVPSQRLRNPGADAGLARERLPRRILAI